MNWYKLLEATSYGMRKYVIKEKKKFKRCENNSSGEKKVVFHK